MVAKTLIIISKKREKEMISRMKFWCVRLRKRGEIFTKKMENVVTNDHRDNLFFGGWEEIWETQNTEKPHFTRKIYDIVLFYPNSFPKKMFLGSFWEVFGAFLGNAERMVYCDKEKLQRAL